MSAPVTAIIPNWNGGERLLRVINDLARQTLKPERVLVVDNASTDSSAQEAERQGATVMRLKGNRGFAHAVNLGWQATGTPLVTILNNDVELEADWLGHLLAAMKSGAWFATGKILQARRTDLIDATFDLVCRGGCAWRCGSGKPDNRIWNERQAIQSAPFTALLLRTELFHQVGGLDERFESYLEDVDFGLRCALAGYEGVYAPEAVARHWGSATLGLWHPETTRLIARNQIFLASKYCTRDSWPWATVVAQLLWGLVALRHGAFAGWVRGKWEGLHADIEWKQPGDEIQIREIFRRHEDRIHELQSATGSEWYWRLYFALT